MKYQKILATLSVGFRLKTYFNFYIKNSKSGMDKVRVMQAKDLEITIKHFTGRNRRQENRQR